MRMMFCGLAAVAISAAPASAKNDPVAKNDQVLIGDAPAWVVPTNLLDVPADPAGLIFMRRQDVVVHLDAQGQDQYMGYRLKILNPQALDIGNIAIAWNPEAGRPVVHALKVYRGAESFDVLKTSKFEVLRREDQMEQSWLDGVLTAVLRVPDLRVGDELEVAFTTPGSDPTLRDKSLGFLMLGDAPPAGRYRLRLAWEPGLEPGLRLSPDFAAIATRGQRDIEFRFENPPLLAAPKDAPARYQVQRRMEYSRFATWEEVSRRISSIFAAATQIAPDSGLRAEAAQIMAANADPLARAAAALALVQQNVRYVYVGLNSGGLTPATADQTWQRRYGDCKGKTVLLLALLRAMGITAEPVLVNNSGADDGLDERLAGTLAFDHVLVRAQVGDKRYWLDGTLPDVAAPALEPALPYRWVLPLSEQGQALERIAWKPAAQPDLITMFDIDARAGFEQPATVTSTIITRGLPGLQQYAQLSGVTPDQLLGAMRQQVVGNGWQTVDAAKWRYDRKSRASIMTIHGTWTLDWDNDGRGARSLALPGGGFSPPERRVRPAGQDQAIPFANKPEFDCRVTTVRLPSSTKTADWSTKPGFDTRLFGINYYRAFQIREGAARMIRGMRVERDEIDAAIVRQDNQRIAAFNNSMAWIFYDPGSGIRPDATLPRVPTTDEIDWTVDDVPCLAKASLR